MYDWAYIDDYFSGRLDTGEPIEVRRRSTYQRTHTSGNNYNWNLESQRFFDGDLNDLELRTAGSSLGDLQRIVRSPYYIATPVTIDPAPQQPEDRFTTGQLEQGGATFSPHVESSRPW